MGLLRSLVYLRDYGEVYGATPGEMGTVMVLRHNAIWIVMDDSFWDRFGIGPLLRITDPKTRAPIRRNPFLGANIYPDLPPDAMEQVLQKTLASATAVLACNLAFQDVVDRVKQTEKLAEDKARELALSHLVKGIVLQPSGVFAVTRAQEAGCHYLLAS